MPTQSILKCIGPAGSGVLDVHLAQKVYPWMASSGANGCGQIAVMFDAPNRNHWLTRIHFPTFPLYLSIQTYSKPMMACAHEAWLVSWILPQHLTSAMALESVCRGQIFWPAGPTPGKSWGAEGDGLYFKILDVPSAVWPKHNLRWFASKEGRRYPGFI